MYDLSEFVPKVHFEQIPIKNLVSNQEYQRNLSMKHVEKAAASFDLYQINPVKVSRRDGINYVFNGQHTIEIVALVSGSRDTPVWCMVYDDLNYQHEADIFANQMKFVKPLSPYEMFMANVEAGSDKQIIIKELIESYGLEISSGQGLGRIVAVSAIERIYDKYGYHVLSRALRLCIGAWEGDAGSFSANILTAIARLAATYEDELDDATFVDKLGAVSLKTLARNAKERRPGSMGFAEAMVLVYNGKRKNAWSRLSMAKLYSKRSGGNGYEAANEDNMKDDADDDYSESNEDSDNGRFRVPFFFEIEECPD